MILKDLVTLTGAKKRFITNFVNDLSTIQNIQAIVLGGSHATGRAHENSDIDLGIYYQNDIAFSIEDIRKIAIKYAKNNTPVVVDFYEWGPWVNGGAWIETEVGKIDILYRNIDQVENVINEAKMENGKITTNNNLLTDLHQ
jgi:predicted nucleotidyltransferase